MWKAAGIVRNTGDLKAALQQLAALYVEARALSEVLPAPHSPAAICALAFFTVVAADSFRVLGLF